MKKISALLAAVSAFAAPQIASAATTLTFEGHSNTIYENTTLTLDGFTMGIVAGDEQHFHQIDSTQYGLASNGTGVLLVDRDTQLFLNAVGGGAFSLSAFDIAAAFSNNAGTAFTVTGFLNNVAVGTISGSLGQFSTQAGFGSAVDYVTFDGLRGGFELDNVVLNGAGAGAVPEPATWAMMLLGFAVVGAAMRKSRQNASVRYNFA